MSTLITRNITTAIPLVFAEILQEGSKYGSRNGATQELLGTSITLAHPRERYHIVPKRNADPIALTMETLWVLDGRDDIEWLSKYLPRAKNFSDDGHTWRAAYGPRLRKWNSAVDQVERVIGELNENENSRRAVISLWDPEIDIGLVTKDTPCNNWIQFLIRNGTLEMFVTARSNDAMWGWSGINTFEWSVLHEVVANSTSTEVGAVHYFIGSLHLYERHWERAQDVVQSAVEAETPKIYDHTSEVYDLTIGVQSTLEELDFELVHFWTAEGRAYKTGHTDMRSFFTDRFLRDAILMAAIKGVVDGVNPGCDPIAYLNEMEAADAKAAVADWLGRRRAKADEPAAFFTRSGDLYLIRREYLARCLQHLIAVKNATYADSWRRRGEVLSIFPNVCRKWDRLQTLWNGGQDGAGESYYDTLIDLVNYCALWSDWLVSGGVDARIDDFVREASSIFDAPKTTQGKLIRQVQAEWVMLEQALDNQSMGLVVESPGWKFHKVKAIAVACLQMLFLDWEVAETEQQINDTLENIEGMSIPVGNDVPLAN